MKLIDVINKGLQPEYILTEDILNEDNIPSFCKFVIRYGNSFVRILSGNKSPYGPQDKMLYDHGAEEPLGKASFRNKAISYWNKNYLKQYPDKKFQEALDEYLKYFNDWGIRN